MADSDRKEAAPAPVRDKVIDNILAGRKNLRPYRPDTTRNLERMRLTETKDSTPVVDLVAATEDEVHIQRSSRQYGTVAIVRSINVCHFEITRFLARNWRRFDKEIAALQKRVLENRSRALTDEELKRIDAHFENAGKRAGDEMDAIEKELTSKLGAGNFEIIETHPESVRLQISTTQSNRMVSLVERADKVLTQIELCQLMSPSLSMLEAAQQTTGLKRRVERILHNALGYFERCAEQIVEAQDDRNIQERRAEEARQRKLEEEKQKAEEQRRRKKAAAELARIDAERKAKEILKAKEDEEKQAAKAKEVIASFDHEGAKTERNEQKEQKEENASPTPALTPDQSTPAEAVHSETDTSQNKADTAAEAKEPSAEGASESPEPTPEPKPEPISSGSDPSAAQS